MFFLLMIILLLFPFPVIFKVIYLKDDFKITLFNFIIFNKEKLLDKLRKNNDLYNSTNEEAEIKSKNQHKRLQKFSYKGILRAVKSNKFKPYLRVMGSFAYSLGDHAYTSICYGIISSILPFIYRGISKAFKIKHFDFPINPVCSDKPLLSFKFKCIIFMSIANTIYIVILILFCSMKERNYVKRTSN